MKRFLRRAEVDMVKLVVAVVLLLAAGVIAWWTMSGSNREATEWEQQPGPSEGMREDAQKGTYIGG